MDACCTVTLADVETRLIWELERFRRLINTLLLVIAEPEKLTEKKTDLIAEPTWRRIKIDLAQSELNPPLSANISLDLRYISSFPG
jgi:hypothetical protein